MWNHTEKESWGKLGGVPLEILNRTEAHWFQFPAPSRFALAVVAVVYMVIFLLGVAGNGAVLYLVIRVKNLSKNTKSFLMNLAVSDFLMMFTIPIIVVNALHEGPVLGVIGCNAIGFIGGLTGTVSIATLSAISLERYLGIRNCWRPGTGFKWPLVNIPRWQRGICITLLWLYGFVFSVIPLVVPGILYVPEGFLITCCFNYLAEDRANVTFILVFFVGAWLLPFVVISSCYVQILRIVTNNQEDLDLGNPNNNWKRHQEWKIFRTVVTLVALWFLAWTPYACVGLLGIAGMKKQISPVSSMIPAIFCKTCSAIDPYIYTLSHPHFKRELMRNSKLFRRLFRRDTRYLDNKATRTFSFKANEIPCSTSNVSLSPPCNRY